MHRFIKLLLIVLSFISIAVHGQTNGFKFQKINTEDGLSHSLVSSLVEDDAGFLWIATLNGLNKYDGYEFKKYFQGKSNKSPAKNYISHLYKDSRGQIWIHYYAEGIGRLDPQKGTFYNYYPDDYDPKSISSDKVVTEYAGINYVCFFEDSDSTLWIASNKGINRYNRKSDNFKAFQHNPEDPNSLSNNNVISITEDKYGYLWIGTEDGLNRLDKATGEIIRVLTSETHPELNGKPMVSKVVCMDDGRIWVGTTNLGLIIIDNFKENVAVKYTQYINEFASNYEPAIFEIFKTSTNKILIGASSGLYRLIEKGNKINHIQEVKSTKVNHIVEDNNGFIWAGGGPNLLNKYLYRFNSKLDEYQVFGDKKMPNDFFGGEPLSFIKKGSHGLIYIGTVKGGLYKIDTNAKEFGHISSNPLNKIHLSNSDVYSIYEDPENNLWVGTSNGLNLINLKKDRSKSFNNFLTVKNGVNYEYSNKLPAKIIGVIKKTKQNKLWMGAFDYKISLYNPRNNIFLNFHQNSEDTNSFTGWSLRAICVTSTDDVYFGGTMFGLCKLNADGFTFKYYKDINNNGPSDLWINTIIEDKNKLLWIGTFNGLNKFDPKTEKFTYYITKKANKNANIRVILEPEIHGNDILWIGTDGGLDKFNKKTGELKLFTTEQGLPSNTILGILEDEKGYLWLSTLNGLTKFNPVNYKIKNYSVEDGLQSNEFNEGAYFKNTEGILYFGGVNGITYFDPKQIKDNPYPGKVMLTALKIDQQLVAVDDTINGRIILKKAISYTNEVNLTHEDKSVSFEFASMNMIAPNNTRYRFKLEGFEKKWNEVGANRRFANYSNLSSGNYTLVIDCTNSDATWSGRPLKIKVNVLPPFWERLWFRLSLGGFILAMIALYMERRTRALKKQKRLLEIEVQKRTVELKNSNEQLESKNNELVKMSEQLHESDQMKLRFFTNISHEFRTPLTLILSPVEKLIKQKNYDNKNHVRDNLKTIHRNSKRLYSLITQILEARKVDADNLNLLVAKGDIILYVNGIFELFKDYAHSKNISLSFSTKLESLQLYFDSDKIEKILFNILSNALNYTPEGGNVELSVSDIVLREKHQVIYMEVKDSGRGIPEDKIPYIFDRYYQVEKKNSTGVISSGIGLSFVKKLVIAHKGDIKVHSEMGKGTSFIFYIPVEKDSFEAEEISLNTDIEPSNYFNFSKSMLPGPFEKVSNIEEETDKDVEVILIEDNDDLRQFLYNELKDDYHVITASNGKKGLSLIHEHLPSIVISDVMMPVMDGIKLCQEIKNNINTCHISVFLLTAKTEHEHQILGLDSGADDYITKPFNVDTLKLKVENAINTKKKLIEKFLSDQKPIPKGIKINELDHNFLESFIKYVEDNIDADITGDILANELGLSKSNLYKKLKSLTGISVNIYIRNIRLNVAAKLLKEGNYGISDVAYAVGFNNPKYFSSCFRDYFKESPSIYAK